MVVPRRQKDMDMMLDAILSDVFVAIDSATRDRRSAFHSPVVGTEDGDLRVMIVRAIDQPTATLRFHTDCRAPKCAVIGNGAPVGVLFYDRERKLQIRAKGIGRIETDSPTADAAWDESTNFARRCYLGAGPGEVTPGPSSGLPPELEGVQPSDEQVRPGRSNFSVLLVALHHLDWFHLAHTGHRRAQFDMRGNGWAGRWVAP